MHCPPFGGCGKRHSLEPNLDRPRNWDIEGARTCPSALKRPIRSAELEVRPAPHSFGRFEQAKAPGGGGRFVA